MNSKPEVFDEKRMRICAMKIQLQAVYRGRLERLELFRACAAGTPV